MPIELWDIHGQRVTFIGSDEPAMPEYPGESQSLRAPRLPRVGPNEITNTDSLQLGQLYASNARVYFWIVLPIMERSKLIGYLAQQRRLAPNPTADRSVRALAGSGVTSYYHNVDGSLWTTLGGGLASPPRLAADDTTHAWRGPREEVLIASWRIAGT